MARMTAISTATTHWQVGVFFQELLEKQVRSSLNS